MGGLPAADPSHRRIMAKTLGVIHILIPGEPPEHGLSQHSHQRMPAIPARARAGEHFARHRGKTERVIEFPISQQSGVGGHHRSAKLEHQGRSKSTQRDPSFDTSAGCVMTEASMSEEVVEIPESSLRPNSFMRHPANAGSDEPLRTFYDFIEIAL
jgi:hypothetical protein